MEPTEKDLLEGNEVLYGMQKHLNAPKTEYNKFGKFYYRTAEGILQAVKEIMPEGYSITCRDSIEYAWDRHYVKATVTFTNGKHTFSASAYAREAENKTGMDSAQLSGATSSYAKKYALNNLFAIDDAKDADAQSPVESKDATPKPIPTQKQEPVSVAQPKKVSAPEPVETTPNAEVVVLPTMTVDAFNKIRTAVTEGTFTKGYDAYIEAASKKYTITEKQLEKIKALFTK